MSKNKLPLTMKEIPKDTAVFFIRAYHYSKVMPRLCCYYLGIFHDSKLLGVVELGWGTQPLQTIRKVLFLHRPKTTDYLEIGKMCFLPKMNANRYFGSLALATLVNWLKHHTTHDFLYTLADGIEGKVGYVYQAANFYYCGQFKTSVYRDRLTYEKIHPRSARILLQENALFDQVDKRNWLTHDFCEYKGIEKINGRMFRYLYPLTPKAKKMMKEYPNYQRQHYPKNDSLKFESRIAKGKYQKIQQPTFNKSVRRYNTQKYNDL